MPEKYISIVTLNGQEYLVKDAWARDAIEALGNPTHFLGMTTSEIVDGEDLNPIIINGESVTAVAGDIVVHANAEFIYSGNAWIELGDLSGLGDLAYKDTASATYTPAGTVSQPTFSNGEVEASGTYTPAGSVTLTKSSETVVSGVSKSTSTVQGMKTAGSVTAGSAPSFTEGAFSAGSLPTFTEGAFDAGSLPSFTEGAFSAGTLPSWSASVDDSTETLSFSFSAGTLPSKAADTWSAGTLPSKAADTFNGGSAASLSAGFFSAGSLPSKAADTWSAGSLPSKAADTWDAGSVTQVTLPTFEEATFVDDVSATEGSMDFVSSASFNGTQATIEVEGTATGTVSQPTFSGTGATITVQ